MENSSIIKDLEKSFESLSPGLRAETVGEIIRSITRDINRLNSEDKNLNLHLKKIALDLAGAYANQLSYSELRNKSENPGIKVKTEFDASFFESLAILKTELFEALKKL